MKQFIYILLVFIIATKLLYSQSQQQTKDTVKSYSLKEITVFGKKYLLRQNEFPVEKGNLSDVLELGGFSIIRKGVLLAQDVYADGLKRGDYTIVVDGERYHNACPNRMDAPITRINPIEVQSINLVKSSSHLQSGLGGVIEVNRANPSNKFHTSANLTQLVDKSNETDFSVLAENFNQRISLRYTQGVPYKTGDSRTYQDLYSYKTNKKFQFAEGSLFGVVGNWKYSGSLMYSENISFPYLQMDEIKSVVYNASLSYDNYKVYFNYTDHLMNNSLRTGNMFMETHAKNLTVGFVSKFAEIYYRNWDGDNNMRMLDGTMPIYNHILPKINLYSANIFHSTDFYGFKLSGKLGLAYYKLGDNSVLDFYKPIFPDAKDNRIFPLAGVSISRTEEITDQISLGGMIDLATEAPEAEALFIKVQRMMGKPYWSGNPNLSQPLRTTLRANFSIPYVSLDLFGSYIFNYVYLASTKSGMQNYQTFGNVDALILGAVMRVSFKYLESEIIYTYGENKTSNAPLIEILPLHISNTITLPKFYGVKFFVKHTYENAQTRIDPTFKETPSSAWNRLDLGATYEIYGFTLGIDVENILNHTYYRYFSYARNPFAYGLPVFEPGRSFRINIRYNYQ